MQGYGGRAGGDRGSEGAPIHPPRPSCRPARPASIEDYKYRIAGAWRVNFTQGTRPGNPCLLLKAAVHTACVRDWLDSRGHVQGQEVEERPDFVKVQGAVSVNVQQPPQVIQDVRVVQAKGSIPVWVCTRRHESAGMRAVALEVRTLLQSWPCILCL